MQLKQLKKDQLKGGNKIEKVLDSVPEEQTFDCMLLLASLAKWLIVRLWTKWLWFEILLLSLKLVITFQIRNVPVAP